MSRRLRVILLENIAELGRAGDIVAVSEGYARNALFPSGRAALANEQHSKQAAHKKQAAEQANEAELHQLQQIASSLDGTELTIPAHLKNDQTIYGTITPAHIAKALRQQTNFNIKAKDIKLVAPITALGSHEARIALGQGIEATLLIVVKEDSA